MLDDVTVVIPVKNEARNLPRCLERLDGFGPVLVVDSGSSDDTCRIASGAGAEVLQFAWDGRFPKKRNWVLRHYDFKTTWVLFLDADEFVTEAFKQELARVLPDSPHAGYWLNYERWFLGRQLRHGDEFNKLALFRVGAGEYERIEENQWSQLDMEIHEHPVLQGSLGELGSPIEHNEYRGLHHYLAKHNEYASWEAARYLQLMKDRDGCAAWKDEGGNLRPEDEKTSSLKPQVSSFNSLTERQRKKYRHIAKWWAAPVYFIRGYIFKGGCLDGAVGFHFAFCKAVYFYQIRLKIREAQRPQASGGRKAES
ncbi:glycosyltransferase family 2 protein [Coraliomargarita parva]|uniref:glycosyltransferase family 2 protein n=1 Tax=Coraliomargarita parva TaxID=3014050 RepID=UPI0022B59632|nr:glycosyltransferase family 2 protein [Coraliomargarita parva]